MCISAQPPSGGCVLKRPCPSSNHTPPNQPPSGGCVLKPYRRWKSGDNLDTQPPSGGCVLKHAQPSESFGYGHPAAFRRLCVETSIPIRLAILAFPAAFRRLCVETNRKRQWKCTGWSQPPSGGCVLKLRLLQTGRTVVASRLQAAVC